ncbi:transglutaminaseTgpA domain-containing protein, partial [Microbacterium sp.]|uniref:transglutaminase family protein n=1 Tax=Microbacterium sp. TaxID=51671 RepID=UPI003C743C2C
MATLVPLTRVVAAGAWIPGSAALSATMLALGYLLRRLRVPAAGVTLALLATWTAIVTGAFFAADALFVVVPTGAVFGEAAHLVQVAAGEILVGVAPLPVTTAVAFVIVASLSLLTVALDHVVLTARMPLLAAIALVTVWLIPAIAVPAGIDVVAFALLAASVLYLIRAETRTREAPASATRSGGVTAVAITIGAVAIVGALVTTPVLPAPVLGAGASVATSIDSTLDLGADLRRRNDVPVLTMHGDASTLPYLRVATLSRFDGAVWEPDRTRSLPLTEGLEPLAVGEGVAVTEQRTTIAVSSLSSSALPVPFAAVAITGVDDSWRISPYSATVLSGRSSAQGQNYEVLSQRATPTLEQIQAAPAATAESRVDVQSLPEDTPAIIGELAVQVTASAQSDYDKLLALQTWFRGPEFTYSLDAPVEDGFDDQGTLAVAEFLEVKEGYCVHFAGAFALMARALDMPSRIVVGFLPGPYTGDEVDDEPIALVTTSQLHAWPEVFFEGIGWVGFEPTKSLGTPTRFASATDPAGGAGAEPEQPTPTASSAPSSTAGPAERPDQESVDASGATARMIDLRPLLSA